MYCHKNFVRWFSLSLLVVALDQGTKAFVEYYLEPLQAIRLLSFFDLLLTYNPGAAFSFLHNASGWQRYFLIAVTIIVLAILMYWLCGLGSKQKVLALGLTLIIGGAIGNMLDRIITGKVVDFLSFHYATWYWPTFNLADAAISLGVGLLIIDIIFFDDRGESSSPT